MSDNKLLTTEQVANMIGVTPTTVLRWVKAGKLPCLRPTNKVIRFCASDVIDAMRRGGDAGTHQSGGAVDQ